MNIPTLSARGMQMPVIGFGTSQLGHCGEIVARALELGYRHIDTAWKYGTAKAKGKSLAQVVLRWLVQQGNIAPIPRSANPHHMAESLQVFDFTLTDDEMRRIHALARPDGRIANPAGRAPKWDY